VTADLALRAPEIEAAVEDPAWEAALGDPAALAAEGAAMALAAAGTPPDGLSISVLFASDDAIADLNARFRGKDGPTNVLSWPAEDLAPETPGGAPRAPSRLSWDGEAAPLGDLALAYGTCAQEAEAAGLALRTHALHLVLHGTLHLLGFDHETEPDADRMERLESEAMVAAGLPDPYFAQSKEGRPHAAPRSDGSDGR
jgi:probable rRNA maturation factor